MKSLIYEKNTPPNFGSGVILSVIAFVTVPAQGILGFL